MAGDSFTYEKSKTITAGDTESVLETLQDTVWHNNLCQCERVDGEIAVQSRLKEPSVEFEVNQVKVSLQDDELVVRAELVPETGEVPVTDKMRLKNATCNVTSRLWGEFY